MRSARRFCRCGGAELWRRRHGTALSRRRRRVRQCERKHVRCECDVPTNPAPPDPDLGDQTTAEQRIIDRYYVARQRGWTPDLAANPRSVSWDLHAKLRGRGNG